MQIWDWCQADRKRFAPPPALIFLLKPQLTPDKLVSIGWLKFKCKALKISNLDSSSFKAFTRQYFQEIVNAHRCSSMPGKIKKFSCYIIAECFLLHKRIQNNFLFINENKKSSSSPFRATHPRSWFDISLYSPCRYAAFCFVFVTSRIDQHIVFLQHIFTVS